jgi:hypothetical protein
MAVVGHAYVVVHAITDSVPREIVKAFSDSTVHRRAERSGQDLGNSIMRGITGGMGKDNNNNAFSRLSKQFNDLYPEADGLRHAFVRLNRVGMALQSGIGALVGTIGAIAGAAGAVLGPLAGLASSLVAVGSAAITAKVGISIAKFALGGIGAAVKKATETTSGYGMSIAELREQLQQLAFDQEEAGQSTDRAALNLEKAYNTMLRTADLAPNSILRRDAELAYREADLAFRRAKDRQADLEDGLPEERQAGGADPFAGLTPSQKVFAKYLVSINDSFKELRESAANGFLPILQSQIQRILDSGVLKSLETQFFLLGQGAGLAVARFVDVAMANNNMANFNLVLGQMAVLLPKFGTIIGNIFDSLLSVLTATYPLTTRFVDFLERKTGSLAAFLDVKNATGDLTDFFNRSGDIAADFGAFFSGIFSGLGKIIQVNFGEGSPGDTLLQWLRQAGEGFANKDLIGLDTYFDGAVDNFIAMAQTLGGAVETIVRAGSNPSVRAFFLTLDRGSFAFDKLVQNFVESGEGFGNVLRAITEVLAVLSDAGPVNAFMNTIAGALDGVASLLESLEPLIVFLGPLFGVISALALLTVGLTNIILILGSFTAVGAKFIGALAGITKAQTVATIATNGATGALKANTAAFVTSPIGIVVAIAAAILALAVAMNAVNAANMDKAVTKITESLATGGGSLAEASRDALMPLERFVTGLYDAKQLISDIGKVQESPFSGFLVGTMEGTAFAKSIEAVGNSLANIAVTDLPKAQAGFKRYTKELDLNSDEMIIALREMDKFEESLVDQADQLKINIRNTDGTIDMTALLAFALGEGEIAARGGADGLDALAEAQSIVAAEAKRLFDANVELTKSFGIQALEASGWRDSVSDAYKTVEDKSKTALSSVEDFNAQFLAQTLTNMTDSLTESTEFVALITELRVKGLSEAGLQMIRDAGPQAKQLAQALVDGTDEQFKRFGTIANQAALRLSTPFQTAYTAIIDLWASNQLDQVTADGLLNSLNEATDPDALKPVFDKLALLKFSIGVELNQEELNAAINQLKIKFKGNTAGLINTLDRRDRNRINPATGQPYAEFANGGFVSGPGGPRSDSIHAMLSNGEYVVNAKATKNNRALLERINGKKGYADGGLVTPSGGAGINITVNSSPGMNEKELAMAVSRRLAFEIRKGTI